jgi:6-phosphofructokinase 1
MIGAASMKKIAVLTSGGDAPGMNAAIRAVVRSAVAEGWRACGVRNGFAGLIAGTFVPLGRREVGGIIQKGGTLLGSARCPQFREEASRLAAVRALRGHEVDALIVIGGSGSQAGSHALATMGFPVVGVASTIDNDLYGSNPSIGVDTAVNVALQAIDRLRNTAASHHRVFLIEVMGRDCGYLALIAGIAGGAEAIVLPETEADPDELAREVREAYERGKSHALVVVAEGAHWNGARLAAFFGTHRERLGFEPRLTVLGHVQRGGEPGAFDRLLGTQLGVAAVERLVRGETGCLIGWMHGEVAATPLADVVANRKTLDPRLFELARKLAR